MRVVHGGAIEVTEKLYLGDQELVRVTRSGATILERWTTHVTDSCGIRTIPIAETGGWRSPKPDHGDHRNRAWRSPKPGIPITETGDGDRLTSAVRPLPHLR
jgi:hypothetical protein